MARAQLEGAADAALPGLRRALEQAAFVQLPASLPALRSGQERLAVLEAEAERLARRASLGLESAEPPHEYVCSITLELMRDPVVASDGHSYERASIEQVLRGSGLSPRTREPLMAHTFPNRALRTRIEEHEAEQEAVARRVQAKQLEKAEAAWEGLRRVRALASARGAVGEIVCST